ncbi:MAG: hypothetical protein ACKO21_04775 [Nodosilinea sp.]
MSPITTYYGWLDQGQRFKRYGQVTQMISDRGGVEEILVTCGLASPLRYFTRDGS